jgi:hypothetical protein
MTNFPVAVTPADEFEIACAFIHELSNNLNHDDWLDYQYRLFMGRSLGGLRAELIPDDLEDFLNWRCNVEISPSEHALDEFGRHLERREARSRAESRR